MRPMRRMDRLSYLLGNSGVAPERVQFIGRAGIVAVSFFLILVLVLAVSDATATSITTTNTEKNVHSFASTNPPISYKANSGEILGVDNYSAIKLINARKFDEVIDIAKSSKRKRKMIDLTRDPHNNNMQVLFNTWTAGSYSPVHKHLEYSEAFVIMKGSLAFFTFNDDGKPTCQILRAADDDIDASNNSNRAIIIEKNTWHAMTAWPHSSTKAAVIFEISAHLYDPKKQTKLLAPWTTSMNDGLDGDPRYFEDELLPLCPPP